MSTKVQGLIDGAQLVIVGTREMCVVVHGYAVVKVEGLNVKLQGVVEFSFGLSGGSVTANMGRYTKGFPFKAQEEDIWGCNA